MKWLASYMKYPLQSDLFSSLSSFPLPSFFSSFLFFSRLLARFVSSNGNPVAIIVKSRNKPCFCWSMLHCRQGWMWRVLREFGENSSRSSCERLACNSGFFFFFEKKLGRMAPRRGRNFWARIQREEFCRVIEISYGFFFPSKLKLKLFFFSSSSSSPFPRDLIVFNCQGNLWSEEWKKLYTRQLAKISARRKNTIDLSN